MSMDINEVASLFQVIRESAAHGNMFSSIRQAATQKLKEIDGEHAKVIAAAEAKAKAEAEAARPKIVAAPPPDPIKEGGEREFFPPNPEGKIQEPSMIDTLRNPESEQPTIVERRV